MQNIIKMNIKVVWYVAWTIIAGQKYYMSYGSGVVTKLF